MASGALRLKLSEECARHDESMSSLTVLANGNDPYRFDTPANHRVSQWLVEQIDRLGVSLPVHLRGLHYILASAADVIRPNGEPYINDEQCWTWLENIPAKASRWLRYLEWRDIKDERNERPDLQLVPLPEYPRTSISFDFDVDLPYDLAPYVNVTNFEARQKYQLLLFGEKSSLRDILQPIASDHGASLALPTGETSNTMVAEIARHAASDGRPMVIFYFSDADPAGWQMPISVARKLQALRDQQFPDLDVQMQHVTLTPSQVKEYGLPSTPLKESERRSDRWKAAFGVEQTEIDALAALRPDLLRRLANEAIAPFFDQTLWYRCASARGEYKRQAEVAFDDVAPDHIGSLISQAEALKEEIREKVDALRAEMEDAISGIDLDLPDPEVPEAEVSGEPVADVIFSSEDDWADATRQLRGRKRYLDNEDL